MAHSGVVGDLAEDIELPADKFRQRLAQHESGGLAGTAVDTVYDEHRVEPVDRGARQRPRLVVDLARRLQRILDAAEVMTAQVLADIGASPERRQHATNGRQLVKVQAFVTAAGSGFVTTTWRSAIKK